VKALIADDEPIARRTLRELIEEVAGVSVVGEAADGAEATAAIARLAPELVFLDLQMPELDGFGVVRALRGRPLPLIIYVTAYSEHALEAFDSGAVDYLLKPVRPERLQAAVAKAAVQLAGIREREGGRSPNRPPERIPVKAGGELHLLDPDDVVAFQADRELVYVLAGSRRYLTSHPLREWESRLPRPPFRRVHRSTIVNTDHIRKISPTTSKRWLLTMSNGLEVITSKRQRNVIDDATG